MPVDHKRINGPEESVPYELFAREKPQTLKKLPTKLPESEDKIPALVVKTYGEQCQMYIKTGIVSQAKGSAYIEIGQTKVLVSVFDPREIPNKSDYALKGELYCEFKYAPFSCVKRKLHQQNNEEKQYSHIMKKALESVVCLHELPNFQVDIYAMVLEEEGSALSGAITAAGAALADAGVPMYDLITSVTLGVYDGKLVEPPFSEKSRWQAELPNPSTDSANIMILSKLHEHKQICQFYQTGHISPANLKFCIQILSKHCDNIIPIVQKCLAKEIVNHLEIES